MACLNKSRCTPSGGSVFCKDETGRRSGHAPNEKMAEVLMKAVTEAKANISKVRASLTTHHRDFHLIIFLAGLTCNK